MRFKDARADVRVRFQKRVFLGSRRAGLFANRSSFGHDIFSEAWPYEQKNAVSRRWFPCRRSTDAKGKEQSQNQRSKLFFEASKWVSQTKERALSLSGGRKPLWNLLDCLPLMGIDDKDVCALLCSLPLATALQRPAGFSVLKKGTP